MGVLWTVVLTLSSSFTWTWEMILENQDSLPFILGDPGAVSRGRAKWRDESFQERAEEPLGTKSHRTISKRLREYRLLIGQKKSLVLFCPIGEQQLSKHFRVLLHGDCCPAIFIWLVHQNNARRAGKFQFDNPVHFKMLFTQKTNKSKGK